jgi:C4-dicarboxylate-specific signal transduction histidine kinase
MRTLPSRADLAKVEHLLEHFEELEAQLSDVRDGLAHSHRLATLGTVATIIAHEYHNILTSMISHCQFALTRPEDLATMTKAVQKSLAGAEKAAKISSSLLGFASEADQALAAPLASTVQEALTCLGRDPAKDRIVVHIDLPPVQVAMSPLNLQQVFLNLILNAVQAMHRTGGQLRITGEVRGTLVHVTVADSGPGVPPQIMDRLFEPFVTHRADHGDEFAGPRGTGLGLCICRDLIRNVGGGISAQSEPGRGAVFTLTLPLADDLLQ